MDFVSPSRHVVYHHAYPPHLAGRWVDFLAYMLLTSVVSAMPMVINNTPIFLIQWVALATFLSFGLFVEMVYAQIAVLVLLLRLRVQKNQLFRYPLNFIMFFLVSFVSGAVFYFLNGETGVTIVDHPRTLWLGFLYAGLNYFLNQVILSFYLYFIYKNNESYFGKDFIVETITTFITFSIGFIFCIFSIISLG